MEWFKDRFTGGITGITPASGWLTGSSRRLAALKGIPLQESENRTRTYQKLEKLDLSKFLHEEEQYHIYVASNFLHDYIVIGAPGLFERYVVLELMKYLPNQITQPLIVYFHIDFYKDRKSKLKCKTTVRTTLRYS